MWGSVNAPYAPFRAPSRASATPVCAGPRRPTVRCRRVLVPSSGIWSNGPTISASSSPSRSDHPRRGRTAVPKVTYVGDDGTPHTVDARTGDSVMSAAVRNGVPGILAECGGNCSCATCHVYVRPEFAELTGTPGEMEDDLLDMGVGDRRPTSRLACQIPVTEELDGLTVDVPADQP
nr:2Fe-2S iron-sulfur cluster-binding protein [Streptomyces sp. SID4945]